MPRICIGTPRARLVCYRYGFSIIFHVRPFSAFPREGERSHCDGFKVDDESHFLAPMISARHA